MIHVFLPSHISGSHLNRVSKCAVFTLPSFSGVIVTLCTWPLANIHKTHKERHEGLYMIDTYLLYLLYLLSVDLEQHLSCDASFPFFAGTLVAIPKQHMKHQQQ